MADETTEVKKPDEAPQPGGCYITGGRPGTDGKHYGGRVTDCEGNTLNEFDDKEVNTGKPKARTKADDKPADPAKPPGK